MSSGSFVDVVAQRLRDDIINSVLMPGEKLRVDDLVRRYVVGATPIREALSRLLSEGLVELTNNRGFTVPVMTFADLYDLSFTRGLIEAEAVRDALAHRDGAWERGLLTAMEQVRHHARADLDAPDKRQAFFDAHHQLHAALLVGCRLKRLLVLQARLEQQHSRYYRRLPFSSGFGSMIIEEHERLVTAALAGESDALASMLRAHVMLTIETLKRQHPTDVP